MKSPRNHINSNWYKERRENLEHVFKNGKALHNKTKHYTSDSGTYRISITPMVFREKDTESLWAYTYCNVYKGKKLLHNIKRNSEKFPFTFVENHTDGHDYFVCGEDYQAQTIIQLDTDVKKTFIGEKAERELEFCWQKVFVSPDNNKIAVQGFAKEKPKDFTEYRGIRFYEFIEPLTLPLKEIGDRIGYPFGESIGWEGDSIDHFLVAVDEERRQSDDKRISSMTEGERNNTLSDSGEGFAIKRVIYSQPISDGVRKEVYSEWIT